jgi:hypothetical protein
VRDELWPGAEILHFDRRQDVGFTTIPRTLSLVCTLIRHLTSKSEGDATRVYLDLWARSYDEGLVDVVDETEMALSCGYAPGKRAVRSWRERMDQLEELGFILVKPKPSRRHGHVLILHPHDVVERLRRELHPAIPAHWWELYDTRLREIGARPRDLGVVDAQLRVARGEISSVAASNAGVVDLD